MTTNTWDIDTTHSAIHFWVRHLVISKVHGRFAKWAGAIQLDPQDLTRSSVEVTIDAASIDTQVADRDAHLRSADFLDATRYPEMTFRSTRIERADSFEASGDFSSDLRSSCFLSGSLFEAGGGYTGARARSATAGSTGVVAE